MGIVWALILGFTLSAIIQAVVRRDTISGMLGGGDPRTLIKAAGLGAASSSCSYAAVALVRSLFRKGASLVCSVGNVPIALLVRFLRNNGRKMLAQMSDSPAAPDGETASAGPR